MTAYADVVPTAGDIANTYEYIFDVNTGTTALPVWTNIPDITALNPQFAAKLKDIATYAHKGASAQKKVGNDFTLDFQILKIRDLSGDFQPVWVALKAASDANGEANNIGFRYYDALNASDAYQGLGAVSRGNRPSTANDDPGFDAFTIVGVGIIAPIANPVAVAAAPVVLSATPSAAAEGDQITIVGSGFATVTGAAGVTIDGDNATSYIYVAPNTIVAIVPAGFAGSAPIIVTNTTGASNSLPYTRGA